MEKKDKMEGTKMIETEVKKVVSEASKNGKSKKLQANPYANGHMLAMW